MGLRDRLQAGFQAVFQRQATPQVAAGPGLMDLPLIPEATIPEVQGELVPDTLSRRIEATTQALEARQQLARQQATESITLGMGLSMDQDDYQYRRLTTGAKSKRRDLSPLQHDRGLEVAWWLWESNALAKRLVTLMTDLILGEGLTVEATDERIEKEISEAWNHPGNPLKDRVQEFHNALAVNGELIIPVITHPVTGRISYGFLDPYQVQDVIPVPDNILIPDYVLLKTEAGQAPVRLKIVRPNDAGKLEGDVFYLGVNKLPNSLRGRPDLMALADWLDLYDQYLFAEVERLHLLSAFVWDYKITGAASEKEINDKLAKFPTPRPGSVWAHNEKEELEAKTPDLKAADRSEAGRMLRTHIAGCYGFPLSYLGEIDSNKASIEGQNDVLLKTPAARQKVFAGFIGTILSFAVQSATTKNPALFTGADAGFQVRVPEIAAKDIARVGTVLAAVVGAMDTAMANHTASRKVAATVTVALIKHLGVEVDPQEMLDEADLDAEERQAMADAIQAEVARQSASGQAPGQPGRGPNGQRNPPVGDTGDDE